MNIQIPIKKSGEIGPGLAHLGDEVNRDYISQKIDLDTIDDFVAKEKIKRLDFIKINVEGVEFLVFKGGVNSIESFRPTIIYEVNHEYMKRMRLKVEELFSFLKKLNYEFYLMENLAFTKTDSYTKAAYYLFTAKGSDVLI